MRLLERDLFADQLRTWLADAVVGRGRLVLLGGEAGVGKTALVHNFTEQANKQARVLIGACDSLATPRPLGPPFDIAPQLDPSLEELLEAQHTDRDRIFRALLADMTRTQRASRSRLGTTSVWPGRTAANARLGPGRARSGSGRGSACGR